MSQENVETARTIYEQYARGDFSWFAELGEDFELVTSRENPDAGVYRGETARRWLWAWVRSFERLTIEATEIIDAGEKVVVGMIQRGCPREPNNDGGPLVAGGHVSPRRDRAVRAVCGPRPGTRSRGAAGRMKVKSL